MRKKLKEFYTSNPIPEIISNELFFEMQSNHLIDTDWLKRYLIRREYHYLTFDKAMKPHEAYEFLSEKWTFSFHTIAGYIRRVDLLYTENSYWDNLKKSENILVTSFAKLMCKFGIKIYSNH